MSRVYSGGHLKFASFAVGPSILSKQSYRNGRELKRKCRLKNRAFHPQGVYLPMQVVHFRRHPFNVSTSEVCISLRQLEWAKKPFFFLFISLIIKATFICLWCCCLRCCVACGVLEVCHVQGVPQHRYLTFRFETASLSKS